MRKTSILLLLLFTGCRCQINSRPATDSSIWHKVQGQCNIMACLFTATIVMPSGRVIECIRFSDDMECFQVSPPIPENTRARAYVGG